MAWLVPRLWEGEDVWILGGGPSVTSQFNIPENVVQDVIKGSSPPSIYSSYMSKLHDKHVIGINVSYLIGDWIDMIFFGDQGFLLQHLNGLAEFPGIKISCHHLAERYDWIKYLPKDSTHTRGISDNPHWVSWNQNSGSAAISIAANAGAKRIILLGFDMRMNAADEQHWHDLYGRKESMKNRNPRRPFKPPFVRHLMGFDQIAKDAKRRGIEIINCSPESAITQFRKCNVADIL